MGASACRLGVPDACGFLWEEVAARQRSSEAWAGEIPPTPLVARYLRLLPVTIVGDSLNASSRYPKCRTD